MGVFLRCCGYSAIRASEVVEGKFSGEWNPDMILVIMFQVDLRVGPTLGVHAVSYALFFTSRNSVPKNKYFGGASLTPFLTYNAVKATDASAWRHMYGFVSARTGAND